MGLLWKWTLVSVLGHVQRSLSSSIDLKASILNAKLNTKQPFLYAWRATYNLCKVVSPLWIPILGWKLPCYRTENKNSTALSCRSNNPNATTPFKILMASKSYWVYCCIVFGQNSFKEDSTVQYRIESLLVWMCNTLFPPVCKYNYMGQGTMANLKVWMFDLMDFV